MTSNSTPINSIMQNDSNNAPNGPEQNNSDPNLVNDILNDLDNDNDNQQHLHHQQQKGSARNDCYCFSRIF